MRMASGSGVIPAPVFRPPFNLTRASHLVLHVPDLQASKAFYVDTLGFFLSLEEKGRLHLRGLEEGCFHSLVLETGEPTCSRVGFRVLTEDDLDAAEHHFRARGMPTAWVDVPHQGRTLHTADAVGTPLELCVSMRPQPRQILNVSQFRGASPQRLDHFQVTTPHVQAALEFYNEIGFRLSEYITPDNSPDPTFVFLQRKGNPHDIVFSRGAGPRLHHVAYTVPESHHLLFLCDQLAENGFGDSVEYGPRRHFGPGYARTVYLRDPHGHRIEFFTNHYQTIDSEDEPIRFEMSQLLAAGWGGHPPLSWLEEAGMFRGVEIEKEVLEATLKTHIDAAKGVPAP